MHRGTFVWLGPSTVGRPPLQAPSTSASAVHRPPPTAPTHFNAFASASPPTNQSLTAPPGTKPWSSGATLGAEGTPMRPADTTKQANPQPLLLLAALPASQALPVVLQIHIDKTKPSRWSNRPDKTNPSAVAALDDKTNPISYSTAEIVGTNPNQPPIRPDEPIPSRGVRRQNKPNPAFHRANRRNKPKPAPKPP